MNGYTAIPNSVLCRSDVSMTARALYMVLSYIYDGNPVPGGHPTMPLLATTLGVSERHVRSAVRELERVELVRVARHGQGLPNSYALAHLS